MFKIEVVMGVQVSLGKNMWVSSIDLSDTYYHILIRGRFHMYFRVAFADQYISSKQCLNVTIHIFTKVVLELMKVIRQEGIVIHTYVDDWLFRE